MIATRSYGKGLYAALVIGCWIFLLLGAGSGMNIWLMSSANFPLPINGSGMIRDWNIPVFLSMTAMWWGMMAAMMLPGIGHHINRQSRQNPVKKKHIDLLLFCSGYLLPWLSFSVAATVSQMVLENMNWLHPMKGWSINPEFSIFLLTAAGLYQFSAIKRKLLGLCRREVKAEFSLQLGIKQGFYCIGCSGGLMVLMYVGGIMNLYWIIPLCILNMIERQVRRPQLLTKAIGITCLLSAVYLALTLG